LGHVQTQSPELKIKAKAKEILKREDNY